MLPSERDGVKPCDAKKSDLPIEKEWEGSVETKLLRPFNNSFANSIENCFNSGSVRARATTESGIGRSKLDRNEKGICEGRGVSKDDLSFICDRYAAASQYTEQGRSGD